MVEERRGEGVIPYVSSIRVSLSVLLCLTYRVTLSVPLVFLTWFIQRLHELTITCNAVGFLSNSYRVTLA